MSIQSLGGVYGSPTVLPRTPDPGAAEESFGQKPAEGTGQPAQPDRASTPTQNTEFSSLPIDAPPGTDPDLWSVLTADERRYFAKAKALGPVVYGAGKLGLAEAGLQRGGRLDVKV
jgi:hypothetical protein